MLNILALENGPTNLLKVEFISGEESTILFFFSVLKSFSQWMLFASEWNERKRESNVPSKSTVICHGRSEKHVNHDEAE